MLKERYFYSEIFLMPDYKERYQRKILSLCLSDEELSEVENIADRLNMKRAAAAREILVTNSKRLKSQIKKNDDAEILFLYSKISNNINQIAKKMNTNLDKFLSGNGEEFSLLIEEIFEDLERLKKIMIHKHIGGKKNQRSVKIHLIIY
jgi:predicted transcriptional regulator